jgi:tetratricopeptide (TPR) repeat protein
LRIRFLSFCLAALLIFSAILLTAQEDNYVEAWFLYEQGKAKLEDSDGPELGEALLLFQEAIDKRGGTFPEAEMAIGDIYFREGAFALAERQYNKAFELRAGMDISEEKYTILYRLSELYEIQELYADMQVYLLQALEDQPYFKGDQFQKFQDAFLATYFEKGLDHLFKLYRMDGVAFAVAAHAKLGWFYYRTGRPTAILHCLFALDIMVSEAVKELRRINPEFVFTTVQAFLDVSLERDNIKEFLIDGEFFKTMYYLATSTYAVSYPSQANSIWLILSTYPLQSIGPSATTYVDLSKRQLNSPWTDPYINPSARKIDFP